MANLNFLPVNRADMEKRGWKELDFLFISGDAYVDHPSFGPALLCRLLESLGYRVGIVAQPDWKTRDDFTVMGKPRLGVLVSAGNMDSMLNKLTAARNRRHKDSYSPGGVTGKRPDRATIVYCNIVRELWGNIPLIIGGIEASLRRVAHYDYWSDKVRRSLLVDSKADILVYGMGESQIREIARCLKKGDPVSYMNHIRGTCYKTDDFPETEFIQIPSYEEVASDRKKFGEAFRDYYLEQDSFRGRTVVQPHGDKLVVQNPPALPLSQDEIDYIYDLPYARDYHPMYKELGGVPAIEEVKFSITSHRGCFGGCSFCAIVSHQGRIMQARSHESIIKEARIITNMPGFKGYIHDVGGPTANFRHPSCKKQLSLGTCREKACMTPKPCPGMDTSHEDYLTLLRELRSLPKVKKVFIRSGIRYDYLMAGDYREFLDELCEHHVSGHLKVAPEHVSPRVLKLMGKPGIETFLKFKEAFDRVNKKIGKEQYLVPYLISSHPGATLEDAVMLAVFIKGLGHIPEQVQDFIPTPGSVSTCMYYTGFNPFTGRHLYVARKGHDKALQRALLQYNRPENHELVLEALELTGRKDLIGYGENCLVPPRKVKKKRAQPKSEDGKKSPRQHGGRRGQGKPGDRTKVTRSGFKNSSQPGQDNKAVSTEGQARNERGPERRRQSSKDDGYVGSFSKDDRKKSAKNKKTNWFQDRAKSMGGRGK